MASKKIIDIFNERNVIGKLRDLLMENLDDLPLTDLYLTHPVLKSKIYGSDFKPIILEFLERHNIGDSCMTMDGIGCLRKRLLRKVNHEVQP